MPVIANTGAMLLIGHKGTNFAFGLSLPNLVRNQHRKWATSHPVSGARDGLPSGSRLLSRNFSSGLSESSSYAAGFFSMGTS
jgi:hypothetical protein